MTPAQVHLYFYYAQKIQWERFKMAAQVQGAEFKTDPFEEMEKSSKTVDKAKTKSDTYGKEVEFFKESGFGFG